MRSFVCYLPTKIKKIHNLKFSLHCISQIWLSWKYF